VAADWLNSGSSVAAPVDTVAEPAVDHLDRLRMTANRASSCLHCPKPGDENVGPLALASIDILIAAAEHAGLPGVATIPTMGAKVEGSLALADGDPPMAGNRCCYLGDWLPCQRLLPDDP